MIDLDQLIAPSAGGASPWEGLTLLGCLAAAYGICWLRGRARRARDSVLFGRHLVDGVLFPLLALALTYSARASPWAPSARCRCCAWRCRCCCRWR